MQAYMIASGDYVRLAEITAPAFEWSTGLHVDVIQDAPIGSAGFLAKLELPIARAADQFIVIDADLMFMRKWEIPDVPRGSIAVAHEQCVGQRILSRFDATLKANGLEPMELPIYNSGLFIADTSHREQFRRMVELYHAGVVGIEDEIVFNAVIRDEQIPVVELPQTVNLQRRTSMRAKGQHLSWIRDGVDARLREMRSMLEKHAPEELQAAIPQ